MPPRCAKYKRMTSQGNADMAPNTTRREGRQPVARICHIKTGPNRRKGGLTSNAAPKAKPAMAAFVGLVPDRTKKRDNSTKSEHHISHCAVSQKPSNPKYSTLAPSTLTLRIE